MKRLLLFLLFVGMAGAIAILLLPREYDCETSSAIRAKPDAVFAKAQRLGEWHLMGMAGTLGGVDPAMLEKGLDQMKNMPADMIKPEALSNVPGVDSLINRAAGGGMDALKGGVESLKNMRCEIAEKDPPNRLTLNLSGGPMNGAKPEITFAAMEGGTKVTIRQKQNFEGFWAGIKAWTIKQAAIKMNETSLANLKQNCETP